MDGRWESLRFPPAIAPPTPRSAAAARSWSRFLEQAEEHSIRGVKIAPLQPRSSRRDVRPTGLVGTYLNPPALAGGLSLPDPVWRRQLGRKRRKRRDGFCTQTHVPVPPPCLGCVGEVWEQGGQQCRVPAARAYRCWGASGGGRSEPRVPASGDLKEAAAPN